MHLVAQTAPLDARRERLPQSSAHSLPTLSAKHAHTAHSAAVEVPARLGWAHARQALQKFTRQTVSTTEVACCARKGHSDRLAALCLDQRRACHIQDVRPGTCRQTLRIQLQMLCASLYQPQRQLPLPPRSQQAPKRPQPKRPQRKPCSDWQNEAKLHRQGQ